MKQIRNLKNPIIENFNLYNSSDKWDPYLLMDTTIRIKKICCIAKRIYKILIKLLED